MKTNKNISLNDVGKKLPFEVPENYFENFALQMDEKIMGKRTSSRKFFKPWMYIAASIVGILLAGQIFYTVYQNNTRNKEDNYEAYVLSQVDESSIVDYYVDKPAN